jgi:hypothetical protein
MNTRLIAINGCDEYAVREAGENWFKDGENDSKMV